MKLVVTVIHPERVDAVADALDEPGVYVTSVSRAFDPRQSARGVYRGGELRVPRERARVEVAVVNEALVPRVVQTLEEVAAAPVRVTGGGSILVLDLADCVPIIGSRQGDETGRGADSSREAPLNERV